MELFLKQHKSVIPRTSQACHECRKRKSKCIGNPCTYCVGKKINCIFPNAKKRGPKIKQIQDSSEVVGPFMPDFAINGIQFMHDIQMTLNTCYQQTSLVDFYFQFLGTFIPMEFKTTLMSPVKSQTTKAQLCIMFAHIVRVFNNTTLHQQFVEEAQKNMNLFTECDTIDSAVALLMMCMLLGFKDRKTAFYANMSHNITKMLYSKNSPETFKLLMVSRALAIEHNFPMFDKLGTLDECIPTTPDGLTPHEWIMVCVTRMDVYMLQYFALDSGTKALTDIITSPLPQDKQRIMIQSVQVLEASYMNSEDSWVINGRFTSSFSRFMLAWKNGNMSEALSYVFKIVEDLKLYSNYIALWKINYTTTLVAIPFFLKIIGQYDLSQQVMRLLTESVSRLKTYQEFLEMSAELLLLPTHDSSNTEAGDINETMTSTIFEQNDNDNNNVNNINNINNIININNINNININNINNNINILEQFDFSPVESLFDHDPTIL